MIIEINITQLIEHKLTFEEYFLLFCIKHSTKELLLNYVHNVSSFSDDTVDNLSKRGYLKYQKNDKGEILFSSLTLGEQGKILFPEENKSFEVCFAELLQTYPKSFGERKLHLDKQRCIDIYKKTITNGGVVNVEKHKLILKCINIYVESHKKTGKMQFLQALPSFLHQKNWEAHIDEANSNSSISNEGNVDLI